MQAVIYTAMAMESLRPVFAKWGEIRIYLFATFANRWLVKFASPYPDPRAEWTDAMSMPWDYGRDLPERVPVIQDGSASAAEDRSVTRSGGDFDHSTATGSIMVPRVDGPIPRRSDPAVRWSDTPGSDTLLHGPSYPPIRGLQISTKGVEKLLAGINPTKAAGPDLMPCRFMKELAPILAPILTAIFQQSMDTGVLPSSWLTA